MKTKPLIAVGYLFIFLAIQTVVQVAALAIEWLIQGNEITELDAIGLLVSTIVFSLITIGLFTWLKWTPVSREYIVSRPWIVLFWCIIAALGAVIPSSFLQELLPEWPESIQQQIDHLSEMMLQLMNVPGGYAALCILAPIAASLIQMAISRSREYDADKTGAEICGNPNFLANGLEKIEYYATHAAAMPQATQATAHMFIINPLKGAGKMLQGLFSTHPDTQERIARLRQQAALMRG